NGVGFDMKYVDQLFNRFKRLHAKAQYPGTGLGLALCKRIIERHGGTIWAQSECDIGTTIFFTIPDDGA
ncbi:MAG TPA: ATP-binding protein, partial [Chroococcales cyanobacterium]